MDSTSNSPANNQGIGSWREAVSDRKLTMCNWTVSFCSNISFEFPVSFKMLLYSTSLNLTNSNLQKGQRTWVFIAPLASFSPKGPIEVRQRCLKITQLLQRIPVPIKQNQYSTLEILQQTQWLLYDLAPPFVICDPTLCDMTCPSVTRQSTMRIYK